MASQSGVTKKGNSYTGVKKWVWSRILIIISPNQTDGALIKQIF